MPSEPPVYFGCRESHSATVPHSVDPSRDVSLTARRASPLSGLAFTALLLRQSLVTGARQRTQARRYAWRGLVPS